MPKITPFLWFDGQAEEAMNFYVSVFKDAEAGEITRYTEAGPGPAGSVMTVSFELFGQPFAGLNGGPHFKFTEAVSFAIECEDQAEVDYYWTRLSDGGETSQCGWLKDRFGLSWQVVPRMLLESNADPDPAKSKRVFEAMMTMTKLDIARLEAAARGA